jgi:hypothetical protein
MRAIYIFRCLRTAADFFFILDQNATISDLCLYLSFGKPCFIYLFIIYVCCAVEGADGNKPKRKTPEHRFLRPTSHVGAVGAHCATVTRTLKIGACSKARFRSWSHDSPGVSLSKTETNTSVDPYPPSPYHVLLLASVRARTTEARLSKRESS